MNPSSTQHVVGIDLGNAKHAIRVTLRSTGEIIDERNITNYRESVGRVSKKYPDALIVMEVGSPSPWTSRFFQDPGHEVLVANPRKVRAIFNNDRKCDLYDARMFAKIARFDPSMLYPIEHQSEQAQRDLLQIKLRDSLVRRRVDIISTVRFTLKSLGIPLKSPHTEYFVRYARRDLVVEHAGTLGLIEPVLATMDTVNEQIKILDNEIEALAASRYPEVARLTRITGVGVLTGLCFVLVVGDHERFSKPRDIATTSAWCRSATSPARWTRSCASVAREMRIFDGCSLAARSISPAPSDRIAICGRGGLPWLSVAGSGRRRKPWSPPPASSPY